VQPAAVDARAPSADPPRSFEYVEGWGMAVGAHAPVLRPRSLGELERCFELASRAGVKLGLRGGGNSYGDASVNQGGWVVDVSRWNQITAFDPHTGRVEADPGVTLEKLWKFLVPRGYWPRVVSGTMYPTLSGALAANIHGKNNFALGTIGDAVVEFDLLSPSGERRTCNRSQNAELFHAAIGGFGQLGAFTRVVLDTKRIHSGDLRVRGIAAHHLGEMMEVIESERHSSDYLVGWVDCFAGPDGLGRGLIHAANYLDPGEDPNPSSTLTVAHQELPGTILGVIPKGEVWRALRLFNCNAGMRLINAAKYQAGRLEGLRSFHLQSHAAFAFLLDYVPNWKWAYGRDPSRGAMIQYQPFVPHARALEVFCGILDACQAAGLVPFLGVLKRHRPDPFWLTHAVDGWSLALDFKVTPANRSRLWSLCAQATERVLEAGGRFYFAKDLVLTSRDFRRFVPGDTLARFCDLKRQLDPAGLLENDLTRRIFR
jgi:FAD/FMN-containing dehydrogenase